MSQNHQCSRKWIITHELDYLNQIFPSHEVTFLKEALNKCGTVSNAVADIVGDHQTFLVGKYKERTCCALVNKYD